MQIDKTNSLAQKGDVSNFTVKNDDGTLSPFDKSRFTQSVQNALNSHEAGGDGSVLVSKLAAQTFDALSRELDNSGTIDAHDIRTQIEMSLVLSRSSDRVENDSS